MFLEFLAALGRLAKEDRTAPIELVRRLGRTRLHVVAPDLGETSVQQAQ